jgi:hypothetical protein
MIFKDHGLILVSVLLVKNAASKHLKRVTGGFLK